MSPILSSKPSTSERTKSNGKDSSPSDIVADERNSEENPMPNERSTPIRILKEYLDASDWGFGTSLPNRVSQEQKIVEMNRLGFNKKII